MATPRMERTVAALLPEDETAEEIALLQSRKWWAIPAGVAAFLLVVTLLDPTGIADILAAAIGGGALGAVMAVATQSYLVARTDRRIVMFRSSKWQAAATDIADEFPLAKEVTRRRSILNDTYVLDDRKLIGSRIFRSRIEEIFTIEG